MRKTRFILVLTCFVDVMMIYVGLSMQKNLSNGKIVNKINFNDFKINNMAASTNMILKDSENEEFKSNNLLFQEVEMEVAPASVIVAPRIEV